MRPWLFSLLLFTSSFSWLLYLANIKAGPLPILFAIFITVFNFISFIRDLFGQRPTYLQFVSRAGLFRIIPTIAVSYTQCSCFGVHLEWGNLNIGIVSLCPVKSEDQKTGPDAASNE